MNKKYILVVEDDAFLYTGIKTALEEQGFSVSGYLPDVDTALKAINTQKPDLALLDIQLKGDKDGIYLAKLIHKSYDFPFIILTSNDTDYTFFKTLNAGHSAFLTKDKTDHKEIIRMIFTVLKEKEENVDAPKENKKLGLQVFVDYKENLKNYGLNQITESHVYFKDIVLICKDESKKNNYVKIVTNDNSKYYYDKSLKRVMEFLPDYFVRINNQTIVNINYIRGKYSGGKEIALNFQNKKLKLTKTYKAGFDDIHNKFFQN